MKTKSTMSTFMLMVLTLFRLQNAAVINMVSPAGKLAGPLALIFFVMLATDLADDAVRFKRVLENK